LSGISGKLAATKWPVGKNVITLSVNIECCRTKCSEVNEQYEVISSITNGESILEMKFHTDKLKEMWWRCCYVSKQAITALKFVRVFL
jgi:hypothetical protein